eukprot:Nitzschia sp. Nitz4//scaffold38_size140716//51505//52779//NITZ4_003138-RA/size140716-processed-gene-0.120-mRNA-1//-1//CDS//3329550051//904//frame0
MGPEGYHWRVLVEDKAGTSEYVERSYSWWDIQDGNAKLPVKEATQYDIRKLLYPSKTAASTTDTATKAAKGAFKMMGKMASAVAGEDISDNHGPPVSIMAFKLLDLMKAGDDVNLKHGGAPPPVQARSPAPPKSTPPARPRAQPAPQPQTQPRAAQPPPRSRASAPAAQPQPAVGNLMDFGHSAPAPAPAGHRKVLHHTLSSPPSMGSATNPNETRAERLKRERIQREKTAASNRVWDPVDERWVEVKPGSAAPGSARSGMDTAQPKAKVVGIKLDGTSAVGKSAKVQQAVAERVSKMEEESQKKVNELREREAKKKANDEEEDVIRKQLDPKIKAWAEEHGKKKQLRALLASLHTVLWPGAKWKQLTIGDLLQDAKVKRAYHKATLVVHPDKTHELPPDQRFLAKRVFDALSQAKSNFDNGET